MKPLGTAFDGTGLSTGSAVASGGTPVPGVVIVPGLVDGKQYHWW